MGVYVNTLPPPLGVDHQVCAWCHLCKCISSPRGCAAKQEHLHISRSFFGTSAHTLAEKTGGGSRGGCLATPRLSAPSPTLTPSDCYVEVVM